QHRRSHADGRVSGQEANEEGAKSHQEQRGYEGGLATDTVAEIAEQYSAKRSGQEADGVGAERSNLAGVRVELREEQLGEDQCRGRAVQEEIVPLDRRADRAGDDGLDEGPALSRFINRLCCGVRIAFECHELAGVQDRSLAQMGIQQILEDKKLFRI